MMEQQRVYLSRESLELQGLDSFLELATEGQSYRIAHTRADYDDASGKHLLFSSSRTPSTSASASVFASALDSNDVGGETYLQSIYLKYGYSKKIHSRKNDLNNFDAIYNSDEEISKKEEGGLMKSSNDSRILTSKESLILEWQIELEKNKDRGGSPEFIILEVNSAASMASRTLIEYEEALRRIIADENGR